MKQRGLFAELWRARTIRIWTFSVCALLVLGIAVMFFIVRPAQKNDYAVPQAVIKIANFTPYFYKGPIPGKFTASKADTSYISDVLLIRLSNDKNQTVIMTQQALPEDLAMSEVVGTETIPGAPGSVIFSSKDGRTTATLFTTDKKTMILLNTSDPLPANTLKDLLRALEPLR